MTTTEISIFRDKERLEFIVATIPTMLALSESARLVKKLREEDVPVKTMVVNQIVEEHMNSKYLSMKLKEQQSALQMVENSPHLSGLAVMRAKMMDIEVRGLPALQYVSSAVWTGMPAPPGGEGDGLVKSSTPLCSSEQAYSGICPVSVSLQPHLWP